MSFKFPENRDALIVMAKLAEQSERYDEMLVAMKKVVKASADLSGEERNLLSVAYKNVIGTRRASWRILSSIDAKENAARTPAGNAKNLISTYKSQVEAELSEICEDILNLLEKFLIPAAPTEEAKVFYYKMKGDYHRYYAEVDTTEEQKDKAHESYSKATEFATSLPPPNPVRLGLALNFSVFYYEILKTPAKGCELARQAFEEAVNDQTMIDEDQHKESTLILQLLRDNLQLWTDDMADLTYSGQGPDDGTQVEEC